MLGKQTNKQMSVGAIRKDESCGVRTNETTFRDT